MFWNAGGFGYVIVLITLGLENLIWLVCDREYQKSYWSMKKQKTYFSFKADSVHFFGKRLNFWQHQPEAVVAAVILIYVLQFVFDDLQYLLISLARGIKYLNGVELLYPLDEFQKKSIFYRGNIKLKHNFYSVADTIKVMFLFYVSLLKIKFVWDPSSAFAVIPPQDQFWFLLMLRPSWHFILSEIPFLVTFYFEWYII